MAVTGKNYGNFFAALANKEHDWNTDVIKCALCASGYTPDQDTHDYFDDITNEITGTGYTAGGATLGSCTITYTGATNKLMLDAADATWTTSTLTWRTAVVYNSSPGSDAARGLICYQTDTSDYSTTAGTATVAWNASGIVEITVD